jgi:hypothetical protein
MTLISGQSGCALIGPELICEAALPLIQFRQTRPGGRVIRRKLGRLFLKGNGSCKIAAFVPGG